MNMMSKSFVFTLVLFFGSVSLASAETITGDFKSLDFTTTNGSVWTDCSESGCKTKATGEWSFMDGQNCSGNYFVEWIPNNVLGISYNPGTNDPCSTSVSQTTWTDGTLDFAVPGSACDGRVKISVKNNQVSMKDNCQNSFVEWIPNNLRFVEWIPNNVSGNLTVDMNTD